MSFSTVHPPKRPYIIPCALCSLYFPIPPLPTNSLAPASFNNSNDTASLTDFRCTPCLNTRTTSTLTPAEQQLAEQRETEYELAAQKGEEWARCEERKRDWIKMEFERSGGGVVEVNRKWEESDERKRLERVGEWVRRVRRLSEKNERTGPGERAA